MSNGFMLSMKSIHSLQSILWMSDKRKGTSNDADKRFSRESSEDAQTVDEKQEY